MKLQFNYLRASFSRRLNIIVAALASIVFIAAVGFLFIQSREAVKDEAMDRASQILNNTVLRVNSILERVEVATNNTDWLVLRHLETPDSMYVYAKSILRNNPELNGCSISFEPYYYPHKGRFLSIYGHRENGEIAAKQEGNDHYE